MFILKTENYFDSAHFLAHYEGKCGNIHGHRWKVEIEIFSDSLTEDLQSRGMVVDFSTLKKELAEEVDILDHALIYEKGSLKSTTQAALESEGFHLIPVPFRPTAEEFARYFYQQMERRGYQVYRATVYETPVNAASYSAS